MATATPPAATTVEQTEAAQTALRGQTGRSRSARPADGTNSTNQPIAFFGSHAATWTARQSQSGGNDDDSVWYQPIVISASLGVFLLYFCVLREENDIDGKLEVSLFDHVDGMEVAQLRVALQYNRERGLPTAALEKRLLELDENKGAKADV